MLTQLGGLGNLEGIGGELGDKAGELLDEVSAATGFSPAVCALAIVALILIAVFIFTKPIKLVVKLAVNTVVGFAALVLVNKLGASFGISLDITWQNAVVTGVFGAPGVALLLILQWIRLH